MSNSLDPAELQYRLKRAEMSTDEYIRLFHKAAAENAEMRAALAAVREFRKPFDDLQYYSVGADDIVSGINKALGKFATEGGA